MFDEGRKLRYFSPAAMRLVIVVHKRPHNCAAVLDRDIMADEPSDAAILTDDDIIAQVRSVNNARPCAYAVVGANSTIIFNNCVLLDRAPLMDSDKALDDAFRAD